METHAQTQKRFQAALEGLTAQLEQDTYVLAATSMAAWRAAKRGRNRTST